MWFAIFPVDSYWNWKFSKENIDDRYHGCAHHCFALVWLELTVWPVVSDSTWLGGGVVAVCVWGWLCVCGGGQCQLD